MCAYCLENISCESDRGAKGLSNVNLELHSGEILGLAVFLATGSEI